MITIASESNYAHSLTFDSIEAVEAEAADCSRYANRADYPSDIAYIANLLDLPESHVHVEEVITLTRSQLDEIERLRRWKREAKQVFRGLGDLVEVADVPLGHSIIKGAIDCIEELRKEIDSLQSTKEEA